MKIQTHNSRETPNRKPVLTLGSALVLLALTGCAVTTKPIAVPEARATLVSDRQAMFDGQTPPGSPVTLEEAMERALRHNLDYRVKLMEEALAQRQLDLSRIDMLPKLVAAAGYHSRDKDNASSSQNVATGQQSLVPSISSERNNETADLSLSWNVLDFGVSYYAGQQQSDRLLILEQRKRRMAQQLMQQVREAWWQAVGAQQLEGRIDALLVQADKAADDARQVEAQKLRSPLESLTYRRQLLDVVRQMSIVRSALAQAKPRLAALMNVPPGTDFQVAVPADMPVPTLGLALDQMQEMALLLRPELQEARYNERIGVLETRKAFARLLPGLEVSIGTHHDDNRFLLNKNWSDAGLRVSWNLMNLFAAGPITQAAQAQLTVARTQRLALNMAVLTQVNVAYLELQGRGRQFALEKELNEVEQRIYVQNRNASDSGMQGRLPAILADANAVYSTLRLYQAYGSLQNAYGQMGASLGLDPSPSHPTGFELNNQAAPLQTAQAQ